MPFTSFLTLTEISKTDLEGIFLLTRQFKDQFFKSGRLGVKPSQEPKVMAEVFFEHSTRTRLSFQMAALRLGLKVQGMDLLTGSSLNKGESPVETIETIAAMKPDLLVVRSGGGEEIDRCLRRQPIPVINAGTGTSGHPTQALLDHFTMQEAAEKHGWSQWRVLFVGDLLHSRVANSNLQLLTQYGAEVAYCSPESLRPKDSEWSDVRYFSNLEEGLKWCNICMGLRLQTERHGMRLSDHQLASYVSAFRLDAKSLRHLSEEAIIMHPGPFVDGVDFHSEVLADKRCMVRSQVTNGVFVRAALMARLLNLELEY